jgi:hypothetical protein
MPIFLFFALAHYSTAQPRLVLVKSDKVVTHYVEGDFIRFKRKDREHYTAGFIAGMTKEYFRIGQDTTLIYQLERIDISEKVPVSLNPKTAGATLLLAGTLLFLGDLFNETVINKESYSTNAGILYATGGLVLTGVALQFAKTGNYKLGRRKKVVVVER